MSNVVQEIKVNSIPEFMQQILDFEYEGDCTVYFRGESKDHKGSALQPSVYRQNYLENEHLIYREMQRFNNHEFTEDRSAFDKLSRMQHYLAPTRLIDFSEDALTALYFAIEKRKNCFETKKACEAIVYVVAIANKKIKYYDSDAVSVISNLAKLPLDNDYGICDKSKRSIAASAKESLNNYRYDSVKCFNAEKSAGFLLHEIKEEKSYFSHIIDPKHIFSAQFVKPKLTNTRIYGQKGAFLLFGLNIDDVKSHIPIIDYNENKKLVLLDDIRIQHPVKKILKLKISCDIDLNDLKKLGVTKPYIYTGMDKVSEHLKTIYE